MKQNLVQYKDLKAKVMEKAGKRAIHEGLDKDHRLTDPKSEYFNKIEQYAFDHLAYYQCQGCKDPYYGGLKSCGNPADQREAQEQRLREEEEAKVIEEAKVAEEEEKNI